jgi:hypothetical protein
MDRNEAETKLVQEISIISVCELINQTKEESMSAIRDNRVIAQ